MPPTNEPTINNVWAANAPASLGETITLPSGQTCRARKLDIQDLVSAGILEQADSLTSLVDSKHVRKVRGGKGPDTTALNAESVLRDSKALGSILGVADKSIPLIVLDPPVMLHYKVIVEANPPAGRPALTTQQMLTPEEREDIQAERPGVVFTDQIGLADKMELFSWAMGEMGGMQSFRGEQPPNAVGVVGHGSGLPIKTKRAARPRKS